MDSVRTIDEMDQQVFIMDLSFNPEITDELMVIYFDLNQEIFCITHESDFSVYSVCEL